MVSTNPAGVCHRPGEPSRPGASGQGRSAGEVLHPDHSRPETLGLPPTTVVVSRTVKRNMTAVDRGVDWASGVPSIASAFCALAGVISAARAPAGLQRTYGKEKVGLALSA